MNVFNWNPLFETGIELIDGQHRRLVELINRLGDAVISRRTTPADSEAVYAELADYALRHFADEERLMSAAGVDQLYFEHHQLLHHEFVNQLGVLHDRQAGDHESASELLGFLAGWLTFHILDEDQTMVTRIRATGRSPDFAVTQYQEAPDGKANAVLLASMRVLFRALADSNARLEVQVRERTRDLLQSEKMAAVGQLAAGVAHEINNPLGFVVSNLGTLGQWARDLLGVIDSCTDWCGDCPELKAKFDVINSNVNLPTLRSELTPLLSDTEEGLRRVRDIVRALQGFAGDTKEEAREYDLLEGLESTLRVVAGVFRDRIELVRDLSPLPRIRCVPSAVNHVFMNLLLNAAAAIAARGVVTLRSGTSDEQVWIEVSDSGCGIRAEHLTRVFEPFFSTRPVGHGMGLGLATAWETVVNQHAGQIEVRSTPGSGSTFTVRLPRQSPFGDSSFVVSAASAAIFP